MFVSGAHFCPCLSFAREATMIPLEWSLVSGYTRVGFQVKVDDIENTTVYYTVACKLVCLVLSVTSKATTIPGSEVQ